MSVQALIVFQKNVVKAKDHEKLVDHTHHIMRDIYADKFIFYSDYLAPADASLSGYYYNEEVQRGSSPGERMRNAFTEVFNRGYRKAVIIGTDCYNLTSGLINEAFAALDDHDAVIGPAKEGGHYLLGIKEVCRPLFENKTGTVLAETVSGLKKSSKTYFLLPELADTDSKEYLKQETFPTRHNPEN